MDTGQLFDRFASRYAASRPHYPTALFGYLTSLTDTRERSWDRLETPQFEMENHWVLNQYLD